MLFKGSIRSSRFFLFILLSCFSIAFVFLLYQLISIYSKKEFLKYQESYYTEQAYTMGYVLNLSIDDDLNSKENRQLYRKLSKKYSMDIELLNEDLDEVIYPNEANHLIDQNDYYVEIPLISNGKMLGYLRAFYNLDDQFTSPSLMKFQSEMEKKYTLLLQVVIVLLVVTNFIVAKSIAKPKYQAAQKAQQILDGDRKLFIPSKGTTETKQLIHTINHLIIESNHMENWRKKMMEDLTHELRTPLTSMLMTMEAIIDGVYPKTEENLENIYNEMDRLSRLIINMQNLSEAERAGFKLNKQKVNVVQLIKGTYEGFLFVAKQKRIKMDFKYPMRPVNAVLDPDRFIQVITNIISNAFIHTEEDGAIEIGVEQHDHDLVFYCQDTGVGISEENQSLIFNRFYRTDQSRSRENGGSGIGLNISKTLIEAHGGEIGVDSRLGEGSRFWAKIPINPS